MTASELIEKAKKAAENSYSPYSGFKVGAALLCESGRAYSGCNVENSAYSPSCCAERTAFYSAVSQGEKNFTAIAIVGGKNGDFDKPCPPCGVCRQVMSEFCSPDFTVYLGTETNEYEKYSLAELLPHGFAFEK